MFWCPHVLRRSRHSNSNRLKVDYSYSQTSTGSLLAAHKKLVAALDTSKIDFKKNSFYHINIICCKKYYLGVNSLIESIKFLQIYVNLYLLLIYNKLINYNISCILTMVNIIFDGEIMMLQAWIILS